MTVIISAGSTTSNTLTAALTEIGYRLETITAREGYIAALIAHQAALILVDGDHIDWAYWVTTAKSSPATRRIPVFVYAVQADDIRTQAHQSGADVVLTPAQLTARAHALITEHARVQSAEERAQLDCDCADALPPLAQQGVAQFNAGEYYQQHDSFEALWMQTAEPVRDLYRAILQVGVAYYQIQRGNVRGAKKMLLRSRQWLNALPDVCQGVDVAALRADANTVYTALNALPDDDLSTFDLSLLRPLQMIQPRS